MRTKIGAALVAAALLALVPVGVSQAQDTSFINVIHGIGEGDNPVDVYVGAGASPTEWNLTVEDLVYGELAEVGDIPAGTYNVLVCNAAVAPADTINACPSGAVNSNAGNEVVVEAGLEYALVAAYGGPETEAPGRPIVAAYELEVSCLETATTARAQGLHAAAAPTVDITANGDIVFNDVSFGESAVADVPAGTYDIGVQLTDGTPVLEVADAELAALMSTLAVVVGNPQQEAGYEILVFTADLEVCPPSSTTTTNTTIITTTTTAARPVTVAPAFTG